MATTKAKAAPAPRMSADEKSWRARDDLRTIQAAQQIQQDKARMTAAQREAQSQVKALQSIGKVKK